MNLVKRCISYWQARPPLWGARIILRSLILLCIGAAPYIFSALLLEWETIPDLFSYSLIIATLVAHLGFLVGILHLTWEMYQKLNRRS